MSRFRSFIKTNGYGMGICLLIAVPAWLLGKAFPLIGGPIIAIIIGMLVSLFWKDKGRAKSGIGFTSKYVLQTAVVLLGFGMNLHVIMQTGLQSLPIIICTITVSLLIARLMGKACGVQEKATILIGVGSSICGGSAIAATAPVIGAKDDEVAQAVSVIFFFNVIAAILFPVLGKAIGFDTATGESFGIFAGTAVNDTSSVTAAAATWDSMWHLGSQTLDKAVTVKLTRTLGIIPITLILALIMSRRESKTEAASARSGFSLRKSFPLFILFFLAASIVTTILIAAGVPESTFDVLKELSKFCIVMAMAAIGLNSDLAKLVRGGGKSLLLGFCCWMGITIVSLFMQHVLGLW